MASKGPLRHRIKVVIKSRDTGVVSSIGNVFISEDLKKAPFVDVNDVLNLFQKAISTKSEKDDNSHLQLDAARIHSINAIQRNDALYSLPDIVAGFVCMNYQRIVGGKSVAHVL